MNKQIIGFVIIISLIVLVFLGAYFDIVYGLNNESIFNTFTFGFVSGIILMLGLQLLADDSSENRYCRNS